MAKLNLVKILNEVREESFNPHPHPYWGLRCNRGLWLTRFPLEIMPEDPAFMMEFVRSGGGLDAMGHWGRRPDEIKAKEAEGWSLKEISLYAKGVPADLCGVKGLNETNWKVYKRGTARAEALDKMGIEFTCSVWTLGGKSLQNFLKKLFCKGLRVTSKSEFNNNLIINYYLQYRKEEECTDYWGSEYLLKEALLVEGSVHWDLSLLSPVLLEYCRKCSNPSNHLRDGDWNLPSKPIFTSLLFAKMFAKKAQMSPWCTCLIGLRDEQFGFYGEKTSEGSIFQLHKNFLLSIRLNENKDQVRSSHTIREVHGFSVCKIARTWFVWSGNFSSHIEGYGNLRSAIDMAEKRRKKDSLILTLNDVRNDVAGTAGFCLVGTKSFLFNRMLHVYRLVEKFDSWGEIPEEIMSIEWALNSKEIFSGYSSPVN